jgi:predicted dehydrogenase/nucleoside-diphosphate-sugar epimerase
MAGELRVGIVGCGKIAEHHIRYIQGMRGARLVGVADVNEQAARQFGRRHNIVNVHSSLEDLLRSTELDVLHVLTPPEYHYACASLALKSGVHVFVEKPIAATLAEARALYDRAAASDLLLCPDFNQLFHPKMQRAMGLLQSGELGRVIHLEIHWNPTFDPAEVQGAPGLPWTYRLPGGVLNNYVTHLLYLALHVAGEPEAIHVSGRAFGSLPQQVVDSLAVSITGLKCSASLLLSLLPQPAVYDVRVYCERGTVYVDFETNTLTVSRAGSLPRALTRAVSPVVLGWALSREAAHNVIEFVRGRLVPYSGLRGLLERFYSSIRGLEDVPISRALALGVCAAEEQIVREAGKCHLDTDRRPSRQTGVSRPAKVLVTGAAGYVGSHVVRELCRNGYYVRALVRPTSHIEKLEELGVEIVFADIRRLEDVCAAAAGMDVIVHTAAVLRGNPEVMRATAVNGTENVAKAAARQGCKRVIYLSSMSVYDYTKLQDGDSITPDSPLEAEPERRGAYSWSKRLAEDVALGGLTDTTVPWTILRPSEVVGGGRDVLAPLGIRVGKSVICGGRSNKNLRLIHVDDLAAAVGNVLQCEATAGRVFTLSIPRPLPLRDYVAAVRRDHTVRGHIIYVPYLVARVSGQLLNLMLKIVGRGPALTERRLSYLCRDLLANSEPLMAATNWQPMKYLPEDLVR